MADRSALARFGGDIFWSLDTDKDGLRLVVGDAITGEGPGQGFSMVPWCLDEYEKVMRLRPGESWLLRRMLAHAWTYGGVVFLSMRAMAYRACVDRDTLYRYLARLEEMGYIRRLADGNGKDRRVRYDVSGTFSALALCIAADPESQWSKTHATLSINEVCRMSHAWPHSSNGNGNKKQTTKFDLDFAALANLVGRKRPRDDD